jgi:DMSO/TMAO reductase YedYZ molybdopterin-dependent catalytic subunit
MSTERRIVTMTPENSETPLERAASWVTPTRLFFVRNHFHVPEVDPVTWRLRVDGFVDRPREWSLEELSQLPERTVHATMECAGNGRSFLLEKHHGVQWGSGAIGHAEWTGVPLRLVLEQSGLKPETTEILFEGLDSGFESDQTERLTFARSLPRDKALDRGTLLVTRMNGEPLEPAHGAPVRLLVPGWYGVASVKWLGRIQAIDYAFRGYYQSKKYTYQRRLPNGQLETIVIGPMMVKAEIIRPQANEQLGLGTNRLFGIAWAGEESVSRVETSTDGGRSWNDAELLGPSAAYSWSMWEYLWEVAQPGRYTLLVRATSTSGRTQPQEYDGLLHGYLVHYPQPRDVQVGPQKRVHDQRADADMVVFDMNAFAEENTRRPLDVSLEFMAGAGI